MSLRSDNVTKGSERAPNRSVFYAMGYTKEEREKLIDVIFKKFEAISYMFWKVFLLSLDNKYLFLSGSVIAPDYLSFYFVLYFQMY